DRGAGRAVGARPRALPRAGGALDLRLCARHRPGRARRGRLARGRGDAAHLRPDLLRGDVLGGHHRVDVGGRPHPGAAGGGRDRVHPVRPPRPVRAGHRAAGPTGYFLKVTLPPSIGTSSIQVWPAGTLSAPFFVVRVTGELAILPLCQVAFTILPSWKSI